MLQDLKVKTRKLSLQADAQPSIHLIVDAVALEEVLDEEEEHLPSDDLVAVHVGHVLELRLQRLVPPRVVWGVNSIESQQNLHWTFTLFTCEK